MAASSAAQTLTATGDEKSAITAMVFMADTGAQARVSADLFNLTLGKANVREGSIDTALALSEWPRDLDLVVVDLEDSSDPVADAAALKTAVPGSCIVIGVGRINDVALYRDLIAVGFSDYIALPLGEGVVGRAVERALEQRERGGAPMQGAATGNDTRRRRCHHDGHHDRRNARHAPQGRSASDRLRPALRLADAVSRPRGHRCP